jgi:hypothetical protein
MLFIRSDSLPISLADAERLRLLDALEARGLNPLIRAARRHFFQSLAGRAEDSAHAADEAAEIESVCASAHEAERGRPYTPGDLFCAGDCVLYLVFGGDDAGGLSAGLIYDIETEEPLAKLERFRRDVREALTDIQGAEALTTQAAHSTELARRRSQPGSSPRGLARFMALQPDDFVRTAAAFRGGRELARASELMEERAVRQFLRRVQEMRLEGYSPRRLFSEAGALGVSVEKMLEAGLLEPEVRVSCRKSGHALFDLPSPDSLAAITLSRAKCSLCAAPVADEVIEETINPTRLAVALLEDGRWLANRVYKIVRSLGVPESEIATGPASPHGESYLVAGVCGNTFLFATRDGDLTPAFSRRVAGMVEETEATQVVVVVTGAVEDEGRMRLYEFAWRAARGGHDLGTTLVEGLDGARAQIEHAFEAAVRRELARSLFPLDAAAGFSASRFVLGWFRSAKSAGAERRADIYAPFVVAGGRR